MENVWIIVTLILLAIILLILWYNGRRELVKKILLYLVIEAEDKFGVKTGGVKHAWVFNEVYPKLPKCIKFFVTVDQLDKWINDSVIKLDHVLHDKLEEPRETVSTTSGANIGNE